MPGFIVLSDIHANLSALQGCLEDSLHRYEPDGIVILGDIINYGMRPNEVIQVISNLDRPIVANLWGNHEKALFDGETGRFSTERGKEILNYTRKILSPESLVYLEKNLSHFGLEVMTAGDRKILFVHGSASDPFWGKMNDKEMSAERYAEYDFVISGHSHIPNLTEIYYPDENRPEFRNKKRTIFLNPGSVGQPRNHNPKAQYLFIDTESETFHFNAVGYDVEYERSLFPECIDPFYKTRLTRGI